MPDLISNYTKLKEQIQTICTQNNISRPIALVAVSKTFPLNSYLRAAIIIKLQL